MDVNWVTDALLFSVQKATSHQPSLQYLLGNLIDKLVSTVFPVFANE